jgi:hypothetical protein
MLAIPNRSSAEPPWAAGLVRSPKKRSLVGGGGRQGPSAASAFATKSS